jgi:hypothetical protein
MQQSLIAVPQTRASRIAGFIERRFTPSEDGAETVSLIAHP